MLIGTSPYDKPDKPKFEWDPERVALLWRCHCDGWSLNRIADALHTTRSAVAGKIFRLKRKGVTGWPLQS